MSTKANQKLQKGDPPPADPAPATAAAAAEDLMKDTSDALAGGNLPGAGGTGPAPNMQQLPFTPPPGGLAQTISGTGSSASYSGESAGPSREMTSAERVRRTVEDIRDEEDQRLLDCHRRIFELERAAKGHGLDSDRELHKKTAAYLRRAIGLREDEPLLFPAAPTPVAPNVQPPWNFKPDNEPGDSEK